MGQDFKTTMEVRAKAVSTLSEEGLYINRGESVETVIAESPAPILKDTIKLAADESQHKEILGDDGRVPSSKPHLAAEANSLVGAAKPGTMGSLYHKLKATVPELTLLQNVEEIICGDIVPEKDKQYQLERIKDLFQRVIEIVPDVQLPKELNIRVLGDYFAAESFDIRKNTLSVGTQTTTPVAMHEVLHVAMSKTLTHFSKEWHQEYSEHKRTAELFSRLSPLYYELAKLAEVNSPKKKGLKQKMQPLHFHYKDRKRSVSIELFKQCVEVEEFVCDVFQLASSKSLEEMEIETGRTFRTVFTFDETAVYNSHGSSHHVFDPLRSYFYYEVLNADLNHLTSDILAKTFWFCIRSLSFLLRSPEWSRLSDGEKNVWMIERMKDAFGSKNLALLEQ